MDDRGAQFVETEKGKSSRSVIIEYPEVVRLVEVPLDDEKVAAITALRQIQRNLVGNELGYALSFKFAEKTGGDDVGIRRQDHEWSVTG